MGGGSENIAQVYWSSFGPCKLEVRLTNINSKKRGFKLVFSPGH